MKERSHADHDHVSKVGKPTGIGSGENSAGVHQHQRSTGHSRWLIGIYRQGDFLSVKAICHPSWK